MPTLDILAQAEPLTVEQLQVLDENIEAKSPDLAAWAAEYTLIRGSGPDGQRIRDLAALYAQRQIFAARGSWADLIKAYARGYHLEDTHAIQGLFAPYEMAGRAAGKMATARLLTTWYGLEHGDFDRLPLHSPHEIALDKFEGYQAAVCYAPKNLGLVAIDTQMAYTEAMVAAHASVRQEGPTGLSQYMVLPQYPPYR